MPRMSESAEIAKIHYRYQVGENKERQDKYAKRKLGRLGYVLDLSLIHISEPTRPY